MPSSYLKPASTIIRFLAVGGAGCNMITVLAETIGLKIRELMGLNNDPHSSTNEPITIAMNTDHQSLDKTVADLKIQLGSDGLGAGCNPDVAKEATEYSKDDIKAALHGSSLVIIFAGLGKGTGSGATPEIARIAKEMGILVMVICTKPFKFDGPGAKIIADKAFSSISKIADCTVPINNSLLHKVVHDNTPIKEALSYINDFICAVVVSIINSLKQTGLMNVDYSDLRTVIESSGLGIVSCGEGDGDDAATKAIDIALNNPILDQQDIQGASSAFIYIAGNSSMSLLDVEKVVSAVADKLNNPNARIVHGTSLDESIGNEIFIRESAAHEKKIKVLIIVTGLVEQHTQNQSAPSKKLNNNILDEDLVELTNFTKDYKADKNDGKSDLLFDMNNTKKKENKGFFNRLFSVFG